MDIYAAIKEDHDNERRKLQALADTGDADGERRERLFPAFKRDLLMHQHVEEAVFYAALKGNDATRPDALEAFNEHHVVEMLLEELDVMAKGTEEWTAKFGVLREMVDHHMREEEEEFFDNARRAIGDDLAQRMAEEFRAKKVAGLSAIEPMR